MGSRRRPGFAAPGTGADEQDRKLVEIADRRFLHCLLFLMTLVGVVAAICAVGSSPWRKRRRRSHKFGAIYSAESSRSFGAPPLMNAFFLCNGKASAYRACRSCLAKGLLWGEKMQPRFVHSLQEGYDGWNEEQTEEGHDCLLQDFNARPIAACGSSALTYSVIRTSKSSP